MTIFSEISNLTKKQIKEINFNDYKLPESEQPNPNSEPIPDNSLKYSENFSDHFVFCGFPS
jgi:hypothetical protein